MTTTVVEFNRYRIADGFGAIGVVPDFQAQTLAAGTLAFGVTENLGLTVLVNQPPGLYEITPPDDTTIDFDFTQDQFITGDPEISLTLLKPAGYVITMTQNPWGSA